MSKVIEKTVKRLKYNPSQHGSTVEMERKKEKKKLFEEDLTELGD